MPAKKAAISQRVALTEAHSYIPAGATGTIYDGPRTPYSWSQPAVWVHWDNKDWYPRWVPANKVANTN